MKAEEVRVKGICLKDKGKCKNKKSEWAILSDYSFAKGVVILSSLRIGCAS